MSRVIWSSPSLRDTLRIFEDLKDSDPVAARRVVDTIEASVERLADFPLSAPTIGNGPTRKLTVRRFASLVFYHVRDGNIVISRVRHAHEDWAAR